MRSTKNAVRVTLGWGGGGGYGGGLGAARRRERRGIGLLPDVPDHRDHVFPPGSGSSDDTLCGWMSRVRRERGAKVPAAVDLRDRHEFTAVEDQGELGSCTAQAVAGLAEFLVLRDADQTIDLSRLFLYRVTRNLMGLEGDSGASLRSTIKAMRAFGVPPEREWPYDIDTFDDEPDAYLYAYASNFKSLEYWRLDPPGVKWKKVLRRTRTAVSLGLPVAFGFTVFSSIDDVSTDGPAVIPFPSSNDVVEGGHAVLIVGYDDDFDAGGERKGAFLIRNSWGRGWGDDGHAWLPYQYLASGLAWDFWTMLSVKWIDEQRFS